jgi:hypothetical protein
MTRIVLAALALACAFASPAFAQAVSDLAANNTVILPYGSWIVGLANVATSVLVPALSAVLIGAVTKVYPWAALFLTQKRVEQMANAVTEYGLNAVPGAVKEGKLSINVGSQVIAKAVQYAVNAAPAKALEAAGGQAGLAAIVFRKLNLEDGATEANTLRPAIAALPGK